MKPIIEFLINNHVKNRHTYPYVKNYEELVRTQRYALCEHWMKLSTPDAFYLTKISKVDYDINNDLMVYTDKFIYCDIKYQDPGTRSGEVTFSSMDMIKNYTFLPLTGIDDELIDEFENGGNVNKDLIKQTFKNV